MRFCALGEGRGGRKERKREEGKKEGRRQGRRREEGRRQSTFEYPFRYFVIVQMGLHRNGTSTSQKNHGW
jgi:hypothetical protein